MYGGYSRWAWRVTMITQVLGLYNTGVGSYKVLLREVINLESSMVFCVVDNDF
ncbi:hypothetical protein RchiOBHm_Chr3g0479731 [Rosa chinensis]|uniref:Uncharacterized protein n=1 Tax=Rosa chinensis TaxID=74649 RepID=A0A2P6RDI5_ROSCH|nr:hypothetical protein RchiOBHm_Chr3g0479731 [Rosa chinensis]